MNTILVPVDFSDVTDQALKLAGNLALAVGARVVLVHVAPTYLDELAEVHVPQFDRKELAQRLRKLHSELQAMAENLKLRGCVVEALMIEGPIVEKICHEVRKRKADMIVIGSHGHGQWHDLLLGSVSKGVMRKAGVPVLVVPSAKKPAPVMM